MASTETRITRGAYGLRFAGVDEAASLLSPAPPDWPQYELVGRLGTPTLRSHTIRPDTAEILTRGGVEIRIEREPGRAVFTSDPAPGPDELVHPLAAHVAAIAAWWSNRESFHAGAFVAEGGVWGLAGERDAGKSSTLAALASDGRPIVCDDLLVLDGLRPFAGPRSIDLRRETAELLGTGEALGMVGERERWRMRLDPVEDVPRLKGLFYLGWAESLSVRPLEPAQRLELLAAHRGVNLPLRAQGAWLALAAVPAWEILRPRRWDALDGVTAELGRLMRETAELQREPG